MPDGNSRKDQHAILCNKSSFYMSQAIHTFLLQLITIIPKNSLTRIYNQPNEWSYFRDHVIQLSVCARPQLFIHTNHLTLSFHWLPYHSCPASQAVTCNHTWRKSDSELQRDLNKASWPVIHCKNLDWASVIDAKPVHEPKSHKRSLQPVCYPKCGHNGAAVKRGSVTWGGGGE